ncbi:MAG: hypothetical protein COB90_10395 [Hyphomicrobiales bacterium]|nr:MAG: hypothetical protein COB90_10395 [Hyphomicrobiales bacterium]
MPLSAECQTFVLSSLQSLAGGAIDASPVDANGFVSDDDKAALGAVEKIRRMLAQVIDQNAAFSKGQFLQLESTDKTNPVLGSFDDVSTSFRVLTRHMELISKGDYSGEISPRGPEDVLGIALADMTLTLRQATSLCQNIANGDFSKNASASGHNDTLSTAINAMMSSLKGISGQAEQIAQGDYSTQLKPKSPRDTLGIAMSEMTMTLSDAATVCQSIAVGDFSKNMVIKSKRDMLGTAINDMVDNFKSITDQANRIAGGDFSLVVEPRSDKDALGVAMAKMTSKLAKTQREIKADQWLKSGQAALLNEIRREQDIMGLSQRVITLLCTAVKAHVGVMYTADSNGALCLTGSYANSSRKTGNLVLETGNGLAGQAVLERQLLVFSDIPPGYLDTHSALGDATPAKLMIAPFISDGKVMGLIEMGVFRDFSENEIDLIKQVSENIAIAISSTINRGQLQQLLDESRDQRKTLQSQQDELQETNAEMIRQTMALKVSEEKLKQQSEELLSSNEGLEEQTKALRESEEELKQQSEELQASNEELEEYSKNLEMQKQAIEKQRSNLDNVRKDLEIQTGELKQSNKYKSEFLSNMSHELRTPLNSMLLLSQSLADNKHGRLSDDEVEAAEVIHSGGYDLLNLINDILDLSKVEAGKIEVNIEEVDLEENLNFLAKQFKPIAENKGLELKFETDDNVGNILQTDGHRLSQILKNLLSNAVKFTSSGSVTLKIHRPRGVQFKSMKLPDDQIVAISVVDTGIGIPEAKRIAIFEAFQQADGATTRNYGGTGLGLTISRELAGLLGGELHLAESCETGSVFTLYLPAKSVVGEVGVSRYVATPVHHDGQIDVKLPVQISSGVNQGVYITDDRTGLSGRDRSALIIEDDKHFAKMLRDIARDWGYKVIVTDHGKEGISFARQYKPAVILLDLGLPDITGVEVLSALKADADTESIPVHIISAGGSDNQVLEMGAVGFLMKPVSTDELKSVFAGFEHELKTPIKSILLIEDDVNTQKAVKHVIGSDDVNVVTVSTGKEGLDALGAATFDCIILDLNLPDMSGFDLLDTMSATKIAVTTPIIVHTGKNLSVEERQKLENLANSVIVKCSESPSRLVDDVNLFLHSVEDQLPFDKRASASMLHDSDKVFEGCKVLLVDDDMRNIFALSRLLTDAGLKVEASNNGKLALEKLEDRSDIDLVLMDVMMPVMDGLEATKRIRAQEKYRNLPIIALTAKAMEHDRAECLEAGANDYMTKPVEPEKLLNLLRTWLYKGAA